MEEVKKRKKKKGPTTIYSKTGIRRIAGYKIQSKIAYLLITNEQSEKEIFLKSTYNSINNNKKLGLSITKMAQDLYTEKCNIAERNFRRPKYMKRHCVIKNLKMQHC